ncbi:MAG: methionine aminotransferase [Flavobacteriales bacterium]
MKSKLPSIGTTIFSVMSKMALETNAINLSQGFPNFPIDPLLGKILKEQGSKNVHQYAPMPGNTHLMMEIRGLIQKSYQRDIKIESELLVCAGATQAIFTTVLALIHPGDEVLILDPCYDCYEPAVILAGGIPIHVQLGDSFLPDWSRINDAITSKTKMMITNNPHNPSGRVWSLKDIDSLEAIMLDNPQLLLLSDEVYEFISFEKKHISMHTRNKVSERTIISSSFGKTFHITGWKLGYLVGPKTLMEEIKKVHQFNVFSVNSLAQSSIAAYLSQTDVQQLGLFYQNKRDVFRDLLEQSRFKLLPCEGTYFQAVSYRDISDVPDLEFCKRLAIENGVAAIPISVFNANKADQKIIRFCFAKDDETLIQASEKLCKI